MQDIYYHRHRGLSTVFFKKMNFFSRRKKSRRKPRLAAAGPSLRLAPERPPRLLCQTPARPFLPRQRRHSSFLILSAGGTAFSSPARRRPVRLSPPGAALLSLPRQRRRQPFPLLQGVQLPLLPRQGQVLFIFPPVGGTGLALCPKRKRASALLSPSAGRGDRAAPPGKNKKPGHPRRGGRTDVFRCQAMKLR